MLEREKIPKQNITHTHTHTQTILLENERSSPLLLLGQIPLRHSPLQGLGCTNFVLSKRLIKHGRQQHGAIGMLQRKPNLRVLSTPVSSQTDRLTEQLLADPLAAIPGFRGPRADDALPTSQTRTAAAALALGIRGGRSLRLEPQNDRADQVLSHSCAENDVIFAAKVGAQPVLTAHPFCEGVVAAREEANGGHVDHCDAAGEHEGSACVPVGYVDELVYGHVGCCDCCEAERVQHDGLGSAVAHFGDGVGYEAEAVELVILGFEGIEGQGRDVVDGRERWFARSSGRRWRRRLELRRLGRKGFQIWRVVVGRECRRRQGEVCPQKGEECYRGWISECRHEMKLPDRPCGLAEVRWYSVAVHVCL